MTNLIKFSKDNIFNYFNFVLTTLFLILITDLLSLKIFYLIINGITVVISFFYIFKT